MVDVFEEVNEDLKDEEFNVWLRKNGPKLVALAVFVILFTAGRVIYTGHKSSVNKEQTALLNDIMSLESADEIIANSEDLSKSHKSLSSFILAGTYAENGDLVKANEVYESIIDSSISGEYKDLAKIYIAQNTLNMENGDLEKAQALIKPMLSKENAFYYVVAEQNALIEYKQGNLEEAKEILKNLSNDFDAPEEVRSRAEKLRAIL